MNETIKWEGVWLRKAASNMLRMRRGAVRSLTGTYVYTMHLATVGSLMRTRRTRKMSQRSIYRSGLI